ncbi:MULTISPECIES: FAD-binding oxidoreductase [unclassified Pseudomonas]|uniref:FAD-binding oxidoreductase n=1 Tax=unclassified Pseudomonas TaxID=196821 RepID=UPI0002A3FA71|nr:MULTISPECIES: FAD-binding oxidoreductase [unclassified Pseudomonas]MBB1610252.1 FAD-linked oxidase [Pseudomonas sp. UMC76]MBB1639915.1 FAD-linked oxidase [Pseudomonas sp. UME83]NTX90744.1 FAD-binding oxidoreductase [Pseudomonas sp. UMA643]NTY17211.1 FAD-binding oxidoreductase [Pseudomonas sp. UMC3103]NTY26664.1 FAD-binding oxidoreductase [Pseudomonas sp. UMA603]
MSELEQTLQLLRQALGDKAVLTGAAINPRHHSDWTRHAPACPAALLLPRDTGQVAAALRICNERGQGVVPQGGMTGLAGGAVPRPQDIALSLERLEGIEELDSAASTLTVRAGTRLETIQQAATEAGLLFPLDLGARGSCQIGGNIACNAGGNAVIRYGMTRDLVLGLEVVLADGRVLNLLNKMIKNNTGYDLKQCFIGSEGTLGVITRAVLKLAPPPGEQTTSLCALPDYASAVALLRRVQRELGTPQAYELMWQDFYRLGVSWLENAEAPLADHHPLYALFDTSAAGQALERTLQGAFEAGEVVDAVIARSHAQARQLWKVREATGEFPNRLQPLNFDVSLPIGRIGEFVERCRERLQARWPGNRSLYFGHIGDSNLHLTLDCRALPQPAPVLEVEELVYAAVGEMAGSVSAEHGIGLLKREFLHHSVSPEALQVMRQLKQALDPRGILNPGKLLG